MNFSQIGQKQEVKLALKSHYQFLTLKRLAGIVNANNDLFLFTIGKLKTSLVLIFMPFAALVMTDPAL